MLDLMYQTPPALNDIEAATRAINFTMASDRPTGALLRALAAAKPGGRLLELGTGTGLGTAWLLDGMDQQASLLTVDTNEQAVAVAQRYLGDDRRVTFRVEDGGATIIALQQAGRSFDLIFADTWPGKFCRLHDTLALLADGGLYIIDDLLPQANWPAGHGEKVAELVKSLYQQPDLVISPLDWSTGVMIVTKKATAV